MMTIPLADAKARLSAARDEVRDAHERMVITRNGRPEAVIMAVSDLEALEETSGRFTLAVATAVVEFVSGALLDSPRLVGKPLVNKLAGYHSARRAPVACDMC